MLMAISLELIAAAVVLVFERSIIALPSEGLGPVSGSPPPGKLHDLAAMAQVLRSRENGTARVQVSSQSPPSSGWL